MFQGIRREPAQTGRRCRAVRDTSHMMMRGIRAHRLNRLPTFSEPVDHVHCLSALTARLGGDHRVIVDVCMSAVFLGFRIACVGVPVVAIFVAAGCASAPRVQETPTEARSKQGIVSFEQIRDPSVHSPEADADQEYRRAVLEEGFTLPAYPEEALAANAAPTEVVVRVVVAEDGSVSSVRRSPLADPPQGEWEELFYGVVSETVAGWLYEPCELRELEDGPDRDGDGTPDYVLVVSSTPMTVYVDLKFRFEIIAGEGRVSRGAEND